MLATTRFELFLIAQVEKCRKLRIGDGHDVAAGSAVAAVGTTAGHKLLPAEAHTTPAAITSDNANFNFVNELHGNASAAIITVSPGKKKAPNGAFSKGALHCGLLGNDVDPFSLFIKPIVKNHTIDLSKKGVVPAHTHILPRVNTGPELANDYVAGSNRLPAENLDAASLPLTVPTVAGASTGFLMRHFKIPQLCVDSDNF
jgi:hypothetical protein